MLHMILQHSNLHKNGFPYLCIPTKSKNFGLL